MMRTNFQWMGKWAQTAGKEKENIAAKAY